MFKKMVSGFVCFAAAAVAYAAGPLDGIYQWNNGPVFYTVTQTGDSLIIGRFRTESGNLLNLNSIVGPGIPATAKQLDIWSLYSGNLGPAVPGDATGSTVRRGDMVGETAFGACRHTLQFTFRTSPTGVITGSVGIALAEITPHGTAAFAGRTNPDITFQCPVSPVLGSLTRPVTDQEALVKIR